MTWRLAVVNALGYTFQQAVGMMDGHELQTLSSAGDMLERHTSLFPFRQVIFAVVSTNSEQGQSYNTTSRGKQVRRGRINVIS